MAIWSINNIVESVRFQKTPYWKLFRTQADKEAGNVIASADFSNPNLGMEEALDLLRKALQRQTPGRYILSAYDKPDGKRGGVSSDVEVENNGINTVSGIGAVAAEKATTAYVEGIGLVSLDNIGDVIDKKIAAIRLKEKEEQRIKNLEEENKRLKTEAREYETGINKGLLSIGSIIWEKMRGTTTGKEVLGMFSDIKKLSNDHQPSTANGQPSTDNDELGIGSPSGDGGDVPQAMVDALDVLAKDNPQLVTQLQMLAKVKTENPDVFQDAIENLKVIAG